MPTRKSTRAKKSADEAGREEEEEEMMVDATIAHGDDINTNNTINTITTDTNTINNNKVDHEANEEEAIGGQTMTQLDQWERENQRDLLHLSLAQAEADELMKLAPRGAELFIGGIPKHSTDEQLMEELFARDEIADKPVECSTVKDPNDRLRNRGYAFAKFKTREECERAFEYLTKDEAANAVMREEDGVSLKKVRATVKPQKHVLFITGFPRESSREEIVKAVIEVGGNGVETLSLPRAAGTGTNGIQTRHKGFGFCSYYNQETAERAMRNLMKTRVLNRQLVAKWADQTTKQPSREDLLSQSKAIYVGQIPTEGVALDEKDLESKLREVFESFGEVEAVKVPKGDIALGYAFIHFAERSSAEKAVEAAASVSGQGGHDDRMNNNTMMDGDTATVQLNGCNLSVQIARPEKQRDISYNNHNNGGGRGGPGRGGGRGGRRSEPYGRNNNYISPHGGGIAPRQFGGGNSMTPVYLPNGQTAFVMGQGNMPAQNVGWGRQSVSDRLDRGGGRFSRGRDRGPRGYDDDNNGGYNNRGGRGGRRAPYHRDDSRDARGPY